MASSNVSNQAPPDTWIWSFQSITILTICSLITLLTILGNGLVLLSVKFRLHTRSYSDYFIVSLCLADFFVGLFVMPLMTINTLHLRWPFHYRLCDIWMSIDFTCSTASFLTLASMALDRYWALTAPYFHLRNRSHTSVLIFIISSWAIPFALWPGSIFLSRYYIKTEPSCVHPAPPFIIVILCTFFYYIPLLFMLACYSRIIVNIKNIEVLIRGTWDTTKVNICSTGLTKTSIQRKLSPSDNCNTPSTTISSFSSLRFLLYKYFQRHKTKTSTQKESLSPNERPLIIHEAEITRQNLNEYRHINNNNNNNNQKRQSITINQNSRSNSLRDKSSSLGPSNRRSARHGTTATFTGQKRCLNDVIEDSKLKSDLNLHQEDEQQLVRARLSTRTLSLPSARCITYYYSSTSQYQTPSQTITTKAIIEDQHRDGTNNQHYKTSRGSSSTTERSRSQSHSSAQCLKNGGVGATDLSDHSSSFDNGLDDEQRRLKRRVAQPSRLSTSYNSNRYSQRAIAQFMHERHKARLRRNQKASRMLGILLAVFLICWLPFTISYPTMIFYPNKFPHKLESIIFWFGYINSLLNPFLYVYSSRNFRQAIIETLCCYVRLRSRQQLRYQWSLRGGLN